MTSLPIVDRELRTAARRAGTHWLRFFAALAALVIWFIVAVSTPASAPVPRLSHNLFLSTGLLALGFCLLAGVFLTADCLSAEKREGTLGLLFLTDLKGHDVVFGKLAATSVHAFYGLLAIFPVMALPLLMGGVTGAEFGRVALVLLVTLFLSLALGLFVSTISRDARHALTATFLTMLLLTGVFPVLWQFQELMLGAKTNLAGHALLLPSPAYTFRLALDQYFRAGSGRVEFFLSLSLLGALACGLLAAACLLLPRRWQEQGERTPVPLRPGRCAARVPVPEADPFHWLASRDGGLKLSTSLPVVLLVVIWGVFFIGSFHERIWNAAFAGAVFSAYALHAVVKCLMALDASRRFSEDRSSGALELVLITPLAPRAILAGQHRALAQAFRNPALLLVMVNLALLFYVNSSISNQFSRTDRAIFTGIFLGGILSVFSGGFALSWIGMEMGLRGKRHHRAVLATLGRVMLPNWLAAFLLVFIGVSGSNITEQTITALIGFWFALGFALDLILGGRAKVKLESRFRDIAGGAPSNVQDREPGETPQILNAAQS